MCVCTLWVRLHFPRPSIEKILYKTLLVSSTFNRVKTILITFSCATHSNQICTYLGGKGGLNTISSKLQPSAPQLRCRQEPIGTIAELRPPVMITPLPYWRAQCECLPSGRVTGNCNKAKTSSSNMLETLRSYIPCLLYSPFTGVQYVTIFACGRIRCAPSNDNNTFNS